MNRGQNRILRNQYFNCLEPDQARLTQSLEVKYGNLCFLPLDLPILFDPKLVDFFYSNSKVIRKVKPDLASSSVGGDQFSSIDVCTNNNFQAIPEFWTSNFYENFTKEFPLFTEQLLDLMPFNECYNFAFWSSRRTVGPHRDHDCMFDLPISFRIMIYDTNPQSTLYVYEDNDSITGQRHYVPRLNFSNSFVWNNLRVEHGSDYIPGYHKILLIVKAYKLNPKKYINLIEKSLAKYKDHVLISKNKTTDFV